MRVTLKEVTCAIALCAFAVAVQAQSTDSSKMAAPKSDMASRTETDYKAAKAACDAKTGAEKDKCVKEADEAHAKAMKGSASSSSSSSTGTMKGTSSSSGTGQK
jgi:hypothetical protein